MYCFKKEFKIGNGAFAVSEPFAKRLAKYLFNEILHKKISIVYLS